MVKVKDVRTLIIGRADRITDIDEVNKSIYFESATGERYTIDFSAEPEYIELRAEYEITDDDYDCSSEIMECLALENKELKKKMKE